MPPDTSKPVPPLLSRKELAPRLLLPDKVPAPAVLPMAPPASVTALATLAPLLMFRRLAPTAMVPVPATAPLPLTTSTPLAMSVPPL